MLSKSLEKYSNSLRNKKHRTEAGSFIAEGEKTVGELIDSSIKTERVFIVPQKISPEWKTNLNWLNEHHIEIIEVSEIEMQKLSDLQTPAAVLGIFKIPVHEIDVKKLLLRFHLVLDGIQDPGNMGTIIRTADWFGIENIFCSENCVDAYNPKVVQSSMGSLARVKVMECDLKKLLSDFAGSKILTTMESAQTIYSHDLPKEGLIIIGSEGRGVSEEVKNLCTTQLSIPRLGKAESLNAALAAGIIVASLKKS